MNIHGIGTDIVDVNRIKRSLKKKKYFKQIIQQGRNF